MRCVALCQAVVVCNNARCLAQTWVRLAAVSHYLPVGCTACLANDEDKDLGDGVCILTGGIKAEVAAVFKIFERDCLTLDCKFQIVAYVYGEQVIQDIPLSCCSKILLVYLKIFLKFCLILLLNYVQQLSHFF